MASCERRRRPRRTETSGRRGGFLPRAVSPDGGLFRGARLVPARRAPRHPPRRRRSAAALAGVAAVSASALGALAAAAAALADERRSDPPPPPSPRAAQGPRLQIVRCRAHRRRGPRRRRELPAKVSNLPPSPPIATEAGRGRSARRRPTPPSTSSSGRQRGVRLRRRAEGPPPSRGVARLGDLEASAKVPEEIVATMSMPEVGRRRQRGRRRGRRSASPPRRGLAGWSIPPSRRPSVAETDSMSRARRSPRA